MMQSNPKSASVVLSVDPSVALPKITQLELTLMSNKSPDSSLPSAPETPHQWYCDRCENVHVGYNACPKCAGCGQGERCGRCSPVANMKSGDSPPPTEMTKARDFTKYYHCHRCHKEVLCGAHSCHEKREVVETYRSPLGVQNLDYAPESRPLPPSIQSSPPELKKLLDALQRATQEADDCECESMPCEHVTEYWASRRAIESLFASQRAASLPTRPR